MQFPAFVDPLARYGGYLKAVYDKHSISNDNKFPSTSIKKFINLVVVKCKNRVNDEELPRHGNVEKILKAKEKVEIDEILNPLEDDNPVNLVLVEGPPGIGKSTLAWHLCKKWDMSQYSLAILLRLREREVQRINELADLFPHIDKHLQQSVASDVLHKEGKGVLFILEGYDELPPKLRREGLLYKLLRGEALPQCTVVVTSRPSATDELKRTRIPQKHIEILGFTKECVKEYASEIFSSEPELIDFLRYTENHAINSLMYIPLNTAIVVEIFRSNWRQGVPVPNTMTELFTQLCMTILKRYLQNQPEPHDTTRITDLFDFPAPFNAIFREISRIAFKSFTSNNVVFHSLPDSVPDDIGFFKNVLDLLGGNKNSYNFLHFTLQEFLAACHISQLPEGEGSEIFRQHSKDPYWNIVWRFVSGLTEFKYFKKNLGNDNEAFYITKGENLEVKQLLIHCLYEAQIKLDLLERKHIKIVNFPGSPLSDYVLSYCIKSSSTTRWEVHLDYPAEDFGLGLNPWNNRTCGSITQLSIYIYFQSKFFESYPDDLLQGVKQLYLSNEAVDKPAVMNQSFMAKIPNMVNLNFLTLFVDLPSKDVAFKLLNILSKTNVTELNLESDVPQFHAEHWECLTSLIDPTSGKLKCLGLECRCDQPGDTTHLCRILFQSSSLNKLSMSPNLLCDENSVLDLLKTNTCLSDVNISYGAISKNSIQVSLRIITEAVRVNKTIMTLSLTIPHENWDQQYVDYFSEALQSNETLKEIIIYLVNASSIIIRMTDPRVKIHI